MLGFAHFHMGANKIIAIVDWHFLLCPLFIYFFNFIFEKKYLRIIHKVTNHFFSLISCKINDDSAF